LLGIRKGLLSGLIVESCLICYLKVEPVEENAIDLCQLVDQFSNVRSVWLDAWDGDLEVVSATGTIARNGLHIHLAIADNKGDVFGGHLHQGCIVNTTVELIVGVLTDNVFTRELDKNTGWKELIVNN